MDMYYPIEHDLCKNIFVLLILVSKLIYFSVTKQCVYESY